MQISRAAFAAAMSMGVWAWGQALTPYVDPLPIPGVMQPVTGQAGGAAHYEIQALEVMQRLHRDLPLTRVWGYGGSTPSATIEARRGQPVTVVWKNELKVFETQQLRTTHPLTVDTCLHGANTSGQSPVIVTHLHGGHVDSTSDGYPEDVFGPGRQSVVFTYPNNQPAGTLWFHDHALGLTRLNVYMGLAGFYLIRDEVEDGLNLPRGRYEIPLAIQDRSFNADGSLLYPQTWTEHFFGDYAVVNGKVWPYLSVDRGKYRFRLLNGSTSRTYRLLLSNGATFWQIGTDLGLMNAPVAMTELVLTPGERADVVMDFEGYAPGTEIVLSNTAPVPYPAGGQGPDLPNIMKFVVGESMGDTDAVPATLGNNVTAIPTSEAVVERMIQLRRATVSAQCPTHQVGMWTLNGLTWDDITEFPVLGTTEIWSWANRSGVSHPMHMHLVSFQVVNRQAFTVSGGVVTPTGPIIPPEANEAGWKDTVNALPNQITRVIARFRTFPGLFPYHCHVLEHEDHEMMRQFRTVCAGTSIRSQPSDASACPGGQARFTVTHLGSPPYIYHWEYDARGAGEWDGLYNGVVAGVGEAAGSGGPDMTLSSIYPTANGTRLRLRITNPCGDTVVTSEARLTVCPVELNCDGAVDFNDYLEFLNLFNAGDARIDYNADGTVDFNDYLEFLNLFNAGC